MTTLWVPDAGFEDSLDGPRSRLPTAIRDRINALNVLFGLMASPDDLILLESDGLPDSLPAAYSTIRCITKEEIRQESGNTASCIHLAPWGWSFEALSLARSLKLTQELPDPQAIRAVNTREFAAEFDLVMMPEDQSVTLPFGRLCHHVDEVREVLRSGAYAIEKTQHAQDLNESRWVIKSNISHAARNRIPGCGPELTEPQATWVCRRLAIGPVFVEPWVERLAECGLQFEIPAGESAPRFLGAAEMLTDVAGQYRGSWLSPERADDRWWFPAVRHGLVIAQRAQSLGFLGAMGIDCMLIAGPAGPMLRPSHDLNGRHTMGRIALSLQRRLNDGEWGLWCHLPEKMNEVSEKYFAEAGVPNVQVVATSPTRIGGRESSVRTCLLISPDCSPLQQLARKILSQDIRRPM